jgi:hypothetical protein
VLLLDELDGVVFLSVDGHDFRAELGGAGQSGRDLVDGVDLGGALEQRPLDGGELRRERNVSRPVVPIHTPMGPRLASA